MVPIPRHQVDTMKDQPKTLEPTVTMSVAIPHATYHALHELRLARCDRGAKLPALRSLVREALETFVERAVGMSAGATSESKATP